VSSRWQQLARTVVAVRHSPVHTYREQVHAMRLHAIALTACSSAPQPPPISQAQKDSIAAEFRRINFTAPSSLEVNETGFVVATFEDIDPLRVSDGGQGFAEMALLRIREQLLPAGTYKQFRVTINGASPGTGMISRYGSARFIEGGKVYWEQGR
jgi:hypothetical protein